MTPSTPLKKVLIITYYWPPAGGPGVQRVLKFAKYLPEFGWQPIILTVKNGEYPAIDESLVNDVNPDCIIYKTGSIEPNFAYKKFTGMASDSSVPVAILGEKEKSRKKRFAHWIRLNLFIPDAKIGWIPFAVHQGKKIIGTEKPDIIFSSSPPPTVHLIARKLAKWSGLKWIADFRDPWTDIHYYENNHRACLAYKIDLKLEKDILDFADVVSCISRMDIELDFGRKTEKSKCINIPNGFDEEDFVAIPASINHKKEKFNLLHLGAVNKERLPLNLFKSIHKFQQEGLLSHDNFKLTFIGHTEPCILESVSRLTISDLVEFVSYLPHHEAIQKSHTATAMLLLITQSEKNTRILPGKTFEYLRMGKSIFGLGPENGEVAQIISYTQSGTIIDYNNVDKIEFTLRDLFIKWQDKTLSYTPNLKTIQHYTRKNLTKQLTQVFEELIGS